LGYSGDGGKEDGGDTGLDLYVLENEEVVWESGEGVVVLLEDVIEIAIDEVIERDGRRDPSCAIYTAVELLYGCIISNEKKISSRTSGFGIGG